MRSETDRKICIIDPLSPVGHRDVNRVMIELTKDLGKLTVICSESLITEKKDGVEYIQYEDSFFKITSNSLDNRKRLLQVLNKMSQVLVDREFDIVIFTSYEIITIYWIVNIMKRIPNHVLKKTYMLNHANVDEFMKSRFKGLLFKRLNRNIRFLCYDKYVGKIIREKFKKEWLPIRHNINDYKKEYDDNNIRNEIKAFFSEKKNYTYIIIPGELAFREDIINQIVELDKTNYLKENTLRVFVKDKNTKYKTNNVFVFNEYMSDAEYSFIFDVCNFVTIIYDPNKYVYRSSGIFFDAVTFKKPMIYCENLFFKDKEKMFGNLGIEYKGNMRDCFEQISRNNNNKYLDSVLAANKYYSDDKLNDDIRRIIESV